MGLFMINKKILTKNNSVHKQKVVTEHELLVKVVTCMMGL